MILPSIRYWRQVGMLMWSICCCGFAQGPPGFGPEGFGGPPGFGGRGGPGGPGQNLKLVKDFDKDGDGRLNAAERKAARASLQGTRPGGPGGFGRGRGGPGASTELVAAGPKLTPSDVKSHGSESLYDMQTLRTLFLQFENPDWESELEDFYHTDVEVPATLVVDGKTYRDVGVHFRGNTSYMMAGTGQKRSLNLSVDYVDSNQRLAGYRTLNLLNFPGDPTFLRTALYLQIARDYIPAPKANFVRLAINGESWGVYASVQQFNSDFTKEWFGSTAGARWKIPMNPSGSGGLTYLGDTTTPYKRSYEIKSKDDPKAWTALINLCRILEQTPPDKLDRALEPLLDIDGALKFLAVEKALINSDGYWIRASDYGLYLDEKGRFHVLPYDVNESMGPAEGPGGGGRGGRGGRGGGGGGGVELDPFAGADDPGKPLLSKLLSVPNLRARYLGYIRDIAQRWLDWDKLGPLARQYQALIAADVEADTHKSSSTEAFRTGLTADAAATAFMGSPEGRGGFRGGPGGPGRGSGTSLKTFADRRRAYLLSYAEAK